MRKPITQSEWDSMREGDWANNPAPSWLDWLPPWALGMIAAACAAIVGSLLIWAGIEIIHWLADVL